MTLMKTCMCLVTLRLVLRKGESVTFSGGVAPIETTSLNALFAAEMEQRTPRNNFKNCLINSAHQFLNKQDGESYILAGYPWFKCRARDMFYFSSGTYSFYW